MLTIEAPFAKGIKIGYVSPNHDRLGIFMDQNLMYSKALEFTHLGQTRILNFIDRNQNNFINTVNVHLITENKQNIIDSSTLLLNADNFHNDLVKNAYSYFAHTLADYLKLFEAFHQCRKTNHL